MERHCVSEHTSLLIIITPTHTICENTLPRVLPRMQGISCLHDPTSARTNMMRVYEAHTLIFTLGEGGG